MVAGYGQGVAAPIIAKALTDRVVSTVLRRLPIAMARAKQIIERHHDDPITSSERDTRHQESA